MNDDNSYTAILETLIEGVWNGGRFELIPDVFAPSAQLHMAGIELEGHEAIRDHYIAPFRTGFPDLHIEVLDVLLDGDKLAMRLRGTGTHDGGYRGKPATGKRLDYTGLVVMHMAGGKIAHVWGHSDAASKIAAF
jgi:predicted ester cyclase